MAAPSITVNGNIVEPAGQQEGGEHFQADASHSNYILLCCTERLQLNQSEELNRLHVKALDFIRDNTYFCRYDPVNLEEVRALPYVVYANVYHPEFVINERLKGTAARPPRGHSFLTAAHAKTTDDEKWIKVYIIPHSDRYGDIPALQTRLVQELGLSPDAVIPEPCCLRAKLRVQDLRTVARYDEVQSIDEVFDIVPLNTVARHDLVADPSEFSPPMRAVMDSLNGEIISVADTGLDYTHEAFNNKISPAQCFSFRPPQSGRPVPDILDTDGHGTHVAASVVGKGDSHAFGAINGTAAGARLFFQCIFKPNGQVLADAFNYDAMLDQAYAAECRIHNFSVGTKNYEMVDDKPVERRLGYTTEARFIDRHLNRRERYDLVVVTGAGNDQGIVHEAVAEIGGIASSKNTIVVGACESSRTILRPGVLERPRRYRYSTEAESVKGCTDAMASFSSRGPLITTVGKTRGRIKPDVVAPGVAIYSARSKGLLTPNKYDVYGTAHPQDDRWVFGEGTSMSTALVSGCCAVIRRALLKDTFRPLAPAALVKALLINGAKQMPRVQPNEQGFGRVSLGRSLLHTVVNAGEHTHWGYWPQGNEYFDSALRNYRETLAIPVPPPPTARPILHTVRQEVGYTCTLKVTMCYNDGANADGSLVNSLTVRVERPIKGVLLPEVRYGNAPAWNLTARDRVNNVQQVVWEDIGPGEVHIIVEAEESINPPDGTQPYALAWMVQYVPRCKAFNDTYKREYNILAERYSHFEAAGMAAARSNVARP
ncbi:subtilisin-like protein [Decorospora gaudefroyi]|uniref:Subtilisin-like protein n=1 Tax=Decorospora gaudefroyi TaxID=184978 RepID=A0A6A5KK07_9PLEO|nr:subtilisin-like protein [Decorospora gaudefroyi]